MTTRGMCVCSCDTVKLILFLMFTAQVHSAELHALEYLFCLLSFATEIRYNILGKFKRKYKDTSVTQKGVKINYRLEKTWIL